MLRKSPVRILFRDFIVNPICALWGYLKPVQIVVDAEGAPYCKGALAMELSTALFCIVTAWFLGCVFSMKAAEKYLGANKNALIENRFKDFDRVVGVKCIWATVKFGLVCLVYYIV